MYAIYIEWNNCYITKTTSHIFSGHLSKAYIFGTYIQAKHANLQHNIGGTIKKIDPKELFKARLSGK